MTDPIKRPESEEALKDILLAGYGDGTVLTNGQAWEFAEMLWPFIAPSAERKPLTDEQIIKQHMPQHGPVTYQSMLDFARAIERAHGIVHKNTQDLDTSEKRVQKTDEN